MTVFATFLFPLFFFSSDPYFKQNKGPNIVGKKYYINCVKVVRPLVHFNPHVPVAVVYSNYSITYNKQNQ